MDKKSKHLMEYISESIEHPNVSGFEALELSMFVVVWHRESPFSVRQTRPVWRIWIAGYCKWPIFCWNLSRRLQVCRRCEGDLILCHPIGGGTWMK